MLIAGIVLAAACGGSTASPEEAAEPDELRRWAIALEGREASPATVLVLGDSVAEGIHADAVDRRWVNVLQDRLRAEFPTAGGDGGIGHLAAHHPLDAIPGPQRTGDVRPNRSRGLGYRAVGIDEDGAVTYEGVVGTVARVWFASVRFGSPLAVAVDGGPAVMIPTSSADASYQDTWTDVPLGDPGPHDVVITRGPGGAFAPQLGGLQVFDGDPERGVQVVDAARSGALAATYLRGTPGGSSQVSDFDRWVVETGSDLAVIALGINEWQTSVDPSEFGANLQSIVDVLRSRRPGLPIALVALYEPIAMYAGDRPWAAYVDQIRALADENLDTVLIDFSNPDDWPQPATFAPDEYYADGLHPTNEGHRAIAERIHAELLAALPDLGPPLERQPDGLIRRGENGREVGDGILNLTGDHQTRRGSSSQAAVTYVVTVQNDGPADRMRLRGGAGTAGFSIAYRSGRRDVTTAVVSGTYRTPLLARQQSRTVRIVVRPQPSAAPGASLSRLLRIASVGDPSRRDVVGFVTTRT